jgi:hypothetical protein
MFPEELLPPPFLTSAGTSTGGGALTAGAFLTSTSELGLQPTGNVAAKQARAAPTQTLDTLIKVSSREIRANRASQALSGGTRPRRAQHAREHAQTGAKTNGADVSQVLA